MTDFTANPKLDLSAYQVDASRVADAIVQKLELVRRAREALVSGEADRIRESEESDR